MDVEGARKPFDVAVAGEIFVDHVFSGFARWPQPGEEHFTDHYVREVGGGVAITSCALGRLGRRAAIFAIAGEQDAWLQSRLRSFGVSISPMCVSAGLTATSVSLSTQDDRAFFTWPGANRELGAYLREPQVLAHLAQARHVHFAMPLAHTLAQELFPPLKAVGCTISLDVGHQKQWLQDPRNLATCREADFFFPNELEGRIMTGRSAPERILEALASKGIPGAVLKLGASGAMAMRSGRIFRERPPLVEVVDTTGAGDAFDAGFLDAMLDGKTLPEQLRQGCLCGAASTRSAGALAGLPDRSELSKFDLREGA